MYIALTKNQGKIRYVLRVSYPKGNGFDYRDLLDLGDDPASFIKYPGGNSFYFDPSIEDAIGKSGMTYDDDAIESVFWPWIRLDIKESVNTFMNRSAYGRPFKKISRNRKKKLSIFNAVHPFDKRRTHFLKFGNMDQGPLENMPQVLFKNMVTMSRDEIEQNFIQQEFKLKTQELKDYVYTVFDLQHFFQGMLAKKMPHALNQEKVDDHFLEQLCILNSQLHGQDLDKTCLHGYLIRYVIMFFDYQYANSVLLEEMSNDFVFRHHQFRPPPPEKQVSARKARKIFNITRDEFNCMNKETLKKLFHKLAAKYHPDKGGDHEKFVALNNAFERLSEKLQ
jgi:hypothetical protein